MLNSEYGLILADDERLIEAGVDQMLSVLRKNPFLASVGGRTLAVYFYRGLLKLHFPYKQMCGYVSQEKNCKTRLIRHMNGLGFMPIGAMYRIFRTKYLVELLLTFSKLSNISTPYKFQFAAEYMSPVFGPSIYLDDLYWVRNWDTPMISKKDWDRNLTFFLWWEEESFKDERLQFCTLLSEKSKIPVEKVGAVFNCMFEDFGSREEPVMGTLGKFKHFISSNYRSNEIRRVGLDQLADRVGFELRKEWPGMGDIHIKQASEAIQSLIPISHKGLFVP
jgi:hypothetical protein